MNVALAQMTNKNPEEFWSNVVHRPSSYGKRAELSQMKNDYGSEQGVVTATEGGPQVSFSPSISSTTGKISSSSAMCLDFPTRRQAIEPPGHSSSALSYEWFFPRYTIEKDSSELTKIIDNVQTNDIEMGTNAKRDIRNTQYHRAEKTATEMHYRNDPHPMLEVPPLYFIFKHFPSLLKNIKGFYGFRWYLSYPLQKRIPYSKSLRKLGVHMTWGELIILMPFVWILILGTLYAFAFPSVSKTGYFSRLPLLFAVGTAVRNSIVTFILGMPFERELWYHKLAGRIAFINGILHTYVAYAKPISSEAGSYMNFNDFAFGNMIRKSGTIILMLMAGIMVSSLPYIRRKFFEVFYYIHIVFVALMTVCAFYHSGVVVPIVAGIFWGADLLIRRLIMAYTLYPNKAKIKTISDTVVEVSFPKTKFFDYNPGQFIYIAVPELSIFEWHPFSLSSCPMQKTVTIHIRKVGAWTSSLHDLAKKKKEVPILLEGPYGSPCVDITDNRYKSILLFSGGIGITPIQSISNQLIYEYSEKQRDLKRLTLVWIERDPVLTGEIDVVQRASSSDPRMDIDNQSVNSSDSSGIASTLLTMFPVDNTPDRQLEIEYPILEEDDDENLSFLARQEAIDGKSIADESTVVGKAYNDSSLHDVLDLQVYLTSKDNNQDFSNSPFIRLGRPDVNEIFSQMRAEALTNKEKRVAVYVCAPARVAQLCRNASVKFSDDKLRFDFHVEGPE